MTRQQRRRMERETRKTGRMNSRASWAGAALAVGAMGMAIPGTSEAATYQVINKLDSGTGSLRDAVALANANPGPDTITFGPRVSGTITLTTGEIVVSDSVNIVGPGSKKKVTVSGNDASRIFDIPYVYTTLDITISGLTLTHGAANDGGAIYQSGNNLTLNSVQLLSNRSSDDGGGLWSDGNTTLNNCTISGNTCDNDGGGIAADGTLVMDKTVVSGNMAGDEGGGVYLYDPDSTVITCSTISGNFCDSDGAGIYFYDTDGEVLIQDTVISGNFAGDDGGGVFFYDASDDITFTRCTISGNTANACGGGIYFYDADSDVTVTIDRSTISGNKANEDGGGIFIDDDARLALTVVNTTISGNTALGDGGGVFFDYLNSNGASFNFCTIAGNSGDNGGGIYSNTGYYGGAVSIQNSIIGDNTAWSDPDVSGSGFVLSYSLVENTGSAGYTDNGGNLLGIDPKLMALASNGGSTKTMLLKTGSPALNVADPAVVSPATDQRGQSRVKDGRADMGAVEMDAPKKKKR